MKHIITISLVALLFLSCADDPCEDVYCVNGDYVEFADDCDCECDPGWTGSSCDRPINFGSIEGVYFASEICDGEEAYYEIEIIYPDPKSTEVIIFFNFYEVFEGYEVYADIIDNAIIIPQQNPRGDGLFVAGQGRRVNYDEFFLDFEIFDDAINLYSNCSATFIEL